MALQFSLQIFNLSSLSLIPFRQSLQLLFQPFQLSLRDFLFFAPDLLLEFKECCPAYASRGIHSLEWIAPICFQWFGHANFRPKFFGGSRSAGTWWFFYLFDLFLGGGADDLYPALNTADWVNHRWRLLLRIYWRCCAVRGDGLPFYGLKELKCLCLLLSICCSRSLLCLWSRSHLVCFYQFCWLLMLTIN